jgi:TPR repeat protein
MSNLGRAYVRGSGVEKDVKRGLDLMLKATDMGNQYAPLFAARVFLKGDDGVKADAGRALGLAELSARRGFEDAYLDLAKGYRDGSFGKADMRKAYFNASLAERFKAEKANELREEIGKKLKDDVRKKVEQEVDLFVEQNGQ